MKSNDTSTVAIYARVSSDQQAAAGTIESQVEELLARASEDGYEVAEELRFRDEGYSGSSTARPALERLRDLASTAGVNVLYVHSPDRLARSFVVQAVLLEELQSVGVEVRFLNRQFGEGPEEQLLLQVQGAIAEYERAKILERGRRGRLHAARRGSVNVLACAPYGYQYVRCPESREAEFRLSVVEAGVVRDIFKWFATERVSIREICRRLNRQGITTRAGAKKWSRGTVLKMLKNPAYRGSAAYGKTRVEPRLAPLRPRRGKAEFPKRARSTRQVPREEWIHIAVPAIVPDDLFEEAQEQIKANRRTAEQHAQGATYLLQGLMVCARCGYALTGTKSGGRSSRSRTHIYYRCLGSQPGRWGGERLCERKGMRGEVVDAAVWQDVCALLQDPSRIQQEYERRLKPPVAQAANDRHGFERVIRSLERARERLVDAYQEGLVDKDEFAARCATLKQRIESLQGQLETVRRDSEARADLRLAMTRVDDFAQQLRSGLDDATWQTRRQIIRSLVKRIEVDDEGLRIVYRVDPRPFVEAPSGGRLQLGGRRAAAVSGTRSRERQPQPPSARAYSVRRMMWNPNGVSTTPLILPGSSAKAAFSKGSIIWPLSKRPSRPRFCALEQSECFAARAAKSAPGFRASASTFSARSRASSFVRVTPSLARIAPL
ncbi:MAG: recombinase family protein [Planctomycetes bacterium]|nr:recombinase family protein [Planctomycetota bacterium]